LTASTTTSAPCAALTLSGAVWTALVANQSLELVLAGIGYHEPLSGQAPLDQAADQRGGHVAAPNECQLSYIVQESTPLSMAFNGR